jgi:hypothetical protein
MEIKTIDYTRHVIGDNVALSFDNFYADIESLKEHCPKPIDQNEYYIYDDDYVHRSKYAFDAQISPCLRIFPVPELDEKLNPRLAPVSPAGAVSNIFTPNYGILEMLQPIIKNVYDKNVTEINAQYIATRGWDHIKSHDAHNVYGDGVFHAYIDEAIEYKDKIKFPGINYEALDKWIEYREKVTKTDVAPTNEEIDKHGDQLNLGILTSTDIDVANFFNKYLPLSKRIKLQNHPNRPQWFDQGSFVCFVFVDFNEDPKWKEIPEVEFWKHKSVTQQIEDPAKDPIFKMTNNMLNDVDIISQFLYYESWHYSEVFTHSPGPKRPMILNAQAVDPWHTLTEYDLINSVKGKINRCVLFPGEYFNKIKFDKWYFDKPMLTQVMVLK